MSVDQEKPDKVAALRDEVTQRHAERWREERKRPAKLISDRPKDEGLSPAASPAQLTDLPENPRNPAKNSENQPNLPIIGEACKCAMRILFHRI